MSDVKERSLNLLKKIRNMYRDNPESWCQDVYAKNKSGVEIDDLDSKDIYQCCLSGAIFIYSTSDDEIGFCNNELSKTIDFINIVSWNDDPERTSHDVVEALDKTIKRLERWSFGKLWSLVSGTLVNR